MDEYFFLAIESLVALVIIIIIGIIGLAIFRRIKSDAEEATLDFSSAVNKVVRLSFTGGVIGFLLVNPHQALQKRVLQENKNGWRVIQVIPDVSGNLFVYLFRILLLVITLFLYTQANGYFVIFEKVAPPPENKPSQ